MMTSIIAADFFVEVLVVIFALHTVNSGAILGVNLTSVQMAAYRVTLSDFLKREL